MAELADALDSGSSESNFMQVQFLLPAPKIRAERPGFIFAKNARNPCIYKGHRAFCLSGKTI